MTGRAWLVWIVGCALAVAACDRGSEYGANETSLSQDRIDSAAGTAGGETGVDDQGNVIDRGAPANARAAGEQARADLPDSASWLPLAGVVGLLSCGGAVGLRLLRRR
jgi:hypothetical protein